MHTGDDEQPRRRVGVFPPAAHARTRRLLAALEQAFAVRFEPRAEGEWAGLDALVCLGGPAPVCDAAAAAGVRTLALLAPEADAQGPLQEVATAVADGLDSRLRGHVFGDERLAGVPAVQRHGGDVLATRDGEPFWTRSGLLDVSAAVPLELGADEALRDRLQKHRFAALLPLVHLLREITADLRWQPPAPSAAFLLDDPNLHWPSYGFLRLPELVRHAGTHGYHLALAMIPLDAWFGHPRAVRLLRDHAAALSLVVHGNNHTEHELGRPTSEQDGVALAAQALRRVRAFERRRGVPVSRVMVPPHEACSEATVRGLLLSGFDAITMTRPYPWLSRGPDPWLARPSGASPLAGWERVDFVAGGLPVMLRHPIATRDRVELVLRAFLDQPLILYGHHEDLAGGLDVLEEAAGEVNALTRARWCSLDEIARTSFETRREGALLRVRMLTRRARLEVPEGVEAIAVELPAAHGAIQHERLLVDGASQGLGAAAEPLAVEAGATVELALRHAQAVDPVGVRAPRVGPLVLARRVVGESRDRALPLLGRAGLARR
jgi:hypothetical protein